MFDSFVWNNICLKNIFLKVFLSEFSHGEFPLSISDFINFPGTFPLIIVQTRAHIINILPRETECPKGMPVEPCFFPEFNCNQSKPMRYTYIFLV